MNAKPHTHCRVCQALLPAPYLDLGEQPLANALLKPIPDEWKHAEPPILENHYPLQVTRCGRCGLSQLTVVIDPEILYSGYRFRSGQSEKWVWHCEDLARRIPKFDRCFMLDIAANDGTQIEAFRKRGWLCTGIDPAPAHESVMVGTWPDAAKYFLPPNYKTPWLHDIIIAQNVLGHVDDCVGFLKAIKTVLAEDGKAIIEVPHVGDLIKNVAFDTIYHEHLSYWSLGPLQRACWLSGLRVVEVEQLPDIHGGSRRYWLQHDNKALDTESVAEERVAEYQAGVQGRATYDIFGLTTGRHIAAICHILDDNEGWNIYGWGASAKAAVMLNALAGPIEIPGRVFPPAIIDDCPEKQGMLLPGVHIPIIPPPDSLEDVDVLWVLSWNNLSGIKEKAKARGFKGKYLVTHPTPRLIDA